jgi:predicted RND superfamily exporter protein
VTRSRGALAVAVLLALGVILGATTLQSSSGQTAAATRADEQTFGAEPIVVPLQGDLATTLDPPNLAALLTLERRVASLRGIHSVLGPATFVEQTVNQFKDVIRQTLSQPGQGPARSNPQRLQDLLVRYGYTGVPSLSNASFVGQLVFGSGTQPKQNVAWLFPDASHALLLIRPRAGLSDAEKRTLSSRIEQLVTAAPLEGVELGGLDSSQQLRVLVRGADVTRPAASQWMNSLQDQVLALDNRLRPGPNPPYFSAVVLSPDHSRAELSFGMSLIPGGERAGLVERLRGVLSRAPAGFSATPAGLIAMGA